MVTELYEKHVSPGGKVSYKLHVPPPVAPSLNLDMTEGEIISAVGGLSILAIHGYQQMVPDHKRVSKKVQKVKEAVLEMFKGTGQVISDETVDFVIAAWDGTMRRLSGESEENEQLRAELEAAIAEVGQLKQGMWQSKDAEIALWKDSYENMLAVKGEI